MHSILSTNFKYFNVEDDSRYRGWVLWVYEATTPKLKSFYLNVYRSEGFLYSKGWSGEPWAVTITLDRNAKRLHSYLETRHGEKQSYWTLFFNSKDEITEYIKELDDVMVMFYGDKK